ncbi:MAG: VOC family protein [Terracidiphilus sp.]|nr:VOC family protein [Terracidiphilus sp.]
MAKAVGVGGVFLKARNPGALAAWYAAQLGIAVEGGGSLVFDGPEAAGQTVFSHFPLDTGYFGDGPQQVMMNFRVDDLDGLLVQLAAAGVRIDPKREDYAYGRFAWIWDPEGNRVELWQAPARE